MPLVSVCIPTYNGATFLADCLESVLAQTFKDFEILVVDDHSGDETLNIVHEYARRDGRIRVIVNDENLGLVGNWNRCVELAKGEWIKFVFQDDLIAPTCLARMLEVREPGRAIMFSSRRFMFGEGTSEPTRQYHLSTLSVPGELFGGKTNISGQEYCAALIRQIRDQRISMNFVGEPSAVMVHRDAFSRFGYFHPYLIHYCDFELWCRVATHTGIIYVPEVLSTFRVHPGSTSADNASTRQYRAMELDPLIMLHDFAFDPVYEPLRHVAQRGRWVDLQDALEDRACYVRKIAEATAGHSGQSVGRFMDEWNQAAKRYPLLARYSQRGVFKRVQVHLERRWKRFKEQFVPNR
jgi:glycosyltransferase involved in cell wall biosynthesis